MKTLSRATGDIGEGIALEFLIRNGFQLVEKNYRKPWGEIDIVCKKEGVIHFVEVKTVTVRDFSRERSYEPEDLVDARKLRKVSRTATLYMGDNSKYEFQIDVIGVLLDEGRHIARCKFFEQVLD